MKPELVSALAGLFGALIGAAASVLTIVVQQHFETKRERMKLHQVELLSAYKTLYAFISQAESMLSSPEDIRRDFIELMRRTYFPKVRPKLLLFAPQIRDPLMVLEVQYDCLSNPDLIARPPFDEFMRKKVPDILEALRRSVEKRTDRMLGE
jgi:hypothetical protein